MKHFRCLHSAFSLVELLVVVAIISILAGAGVAAFGGGGRGPQTAAARASSIFNLARTEAILRSAETFVVIDTAPASGSYLRRLAVAREQDDGALERVSQWSTLPVTAYFNEILSTPTASTNLVEGGQSIACAYYKFQPSGRLDGPPARFVVSQGAALAGAVQESSTLKRHGFKIHKMGKLSFFNNPGEIQ